MTSQTTEFGGIHRQELCIRRLRPALLLAASAALLGGCAVGPDYQTPFLLMPAQWGNATQARPTKPPKLHGWWRRLKDPLLNRLAEQAVAGNLDMASAKARIREARATYKQARGALFPSVDGSASATRTKTASGTGQGNASNFFQAGFDASWELDLFGGNRRAVEAALYGWDAAEEDLRTALMTLIGDVASYYAEARGYQARLALARRTATSQRETAKLTQDKFKAGSTSAVDVANANGQAAATEAEIPTLEAAYWEAVYRLGVLSGQEPNALSAQLKRPGPIPTARLPIPTGIPADVLCNRPDVRYAERQLAQYTTRIGQAEANRYPSVNLTGQITTSGLRIGDLGKTPRSAGRLGRH